VSEPTTPPADEGRCPCCGREAKPEDRAVCAICQRAVCIACLRRYGHHMLACDDCRVAEW
jgi:hypothetical protein